MRRIFFFLFVFWISGCKSLFAQELIWEKKIALSSYEQLYCVTSLDGGDFLAGGNSARFRINTQFGGMNGAILVRFDENGDTLWVRHSGYYGSVRKLEQGENGLIYGYLGYRDTTNGESKKGVLVLSQEGNILFMIPLPVTESEGVYNMRISKGCIWLSGSKTPSIFFPSIGLSSDFLLMKFRMDGTLLFSFSYNPNYPYCSGNRIEFMPNGNILFSGSVGNRIGAFEIDTAGNEIQYRTYYQTGTNHAFQNPRLCQLADGKRIVGGYKSTTPVQFYLGKHDSSGTKIWGGENSGALTTLLPNADNSTILTYSDNSSNTFISRIRGDSTYMWSVNIFGTSVSGYKYLNDVVYEQDESGVVVGSISPASFSSENLYIAKFGGLGIPFDPTSAKAFESMKTDAVPLAFPNPGGDVVRFTILAGPGKVAFTDMKGRKVLEGEYLPEKGINTKSLPAGMYNYKLERNGKVWTGKWVKE